MAKYQAVCKGIKKKLVEAKYCVITTDLWTAPHLQRAYISLTAILWILTTYLNQNVFKL